MNKRPSGDSARGKKEEEIRKQQLKKRKEDFL